MIYTYVATCLFGLEHILGEEIDALGYKRTETIDGRVIFEGDESAVARCNIWLRTAERVFLLAGRCRAESFDMLFEGVRSMPWENYIGERDEFPVKGHSIKSALFSIPDCQKIVKKAVVERLKSKYGTSWFAEDGVKYQIEFFILKDEAMLMIDTSGNALLKRGYRPGTLEAPLRETLAAALALTARPREDVLFWDPFCGSGTIAIEAAMYMKNKAPGQNRKFSAEDFSIFDKSVWKNAREEAESAIKETNFEAYASDINPDCVAFAKECVKRAGVFGTVKAFERNALEISTGGRRGTIVCNPPYGERMFTMAQTEELYKKMGEHFKTLDSWQIYVITSCETFERLYGRRADKVRKLYNGMIPCYFYQFFKRRENGDFKTNKPTR
ncbi:MAG: class I SAM-dependent RNA methyltransferase [Clostridiales bacterium]|nr:class I SAM-dependent RNA methyltransferase [Clostridiales bacterium]